jgi:hypothetical protein
VNATITDEEPTQEAPFEEPEVNPATGEVKNDFGRGAYTIVCSLKKNNKSASRNGLNYELAFDVMPGNAESIVPLFQGDAPRLYWQPTGMEAATLISYGATLYKYIITLDNNEDAQRSDVMQLRLRAADIAVGTAVLEGPWANPESSSPIDGMLTIDPAQMTAGL